MKGLNLDENFKPADTGKFGLGMGTGAERTGGNGKETENAGRN